MDIVHLEHVGGAIEKYAWVANYLDRRVCISHHLKEHIKTFYKQNNISESKEEKLEVIYNGISENYGSFQKDSNQFRTAYKIPAETKIVSFIGRFALEKKPFLFIDIARALLNNSSKHSWKFVMAGNGPYLEKIKTRIKECDLEEHFILPGMLNDVSELLAASFTLLVTSQHEGIPLVIQEAFALKIPVISTNVGAIKELIQEGKNGYLVNLDENTIDQFHNRIVHLANNSNLYSMFSSQARTSLFPKFSQTIMEASYKKIFDDLLIEVPKQTITSTSDLRRKPL
jgi:glycosyltransferase involved in cell wall biosynthesis